MGQGFRSILDSLNASTNLLAWSLILFGAYLVVRSHAAEGGMVITGGFTLLNNGIKKEQQAAVVPPQETK